MSKRTGLDRYLRQTEDGMEFTVPDDLIPEDKWMSFSVSVKKNADGSHFVDEFTIRYDDDKSEAVEDK